MTFVLWRRSTSSIDEEEPQLHEEMHSPRIAASGPMSFSLLASVVVAIYKTDLREEDEEEKNKKYR